MPLTKKVEPTVEPIIEKVVEPVLESKPIMESKQIVNIQTELESKQTVKENIFYGKTAIFSKDKILSKDAITLFEKKGILKEKLFYIVNHIGENITIHKYNESADKNLKELTESLVYYLNSKKVISESFKVEGDNNASVIKGIKDAKEAEIIKGSLIKIFNK